MLEPLAEGWLEAVSAEVASVNPAGEGDAAAGSVVDGVAQVLVSGAPSEAVSSASFYFEVSEGRLSLHPRRHPQPDIVLSGAYQDFLLIWRGELSLEAAYMSGRMKLEGDQVLLFDRWHRILRSQQLREALVRLR